MPHLRDEFLACSSNGPAFTERGKGVLYVLRNRACHAELPLYAFHGPSTVAHENKPQGLIHCVPHLIAMTAY